MTLQLRAQIQLCMVLFCLIVVLISLIALSWRQYGGVIMRSRHDPNWKVRELSPGVSPIMRSKGFGPPGKGLLCIHCWLFGYGLYNDPSRDAFI